MSSLFHDPRHSFPDAEAGTTTWLTIVGIVGDIRDQASSGRVGRHRSWRSGPASSRRGGHSRSAQSSRFGWNDAPPRGISDATRFHISLGRGIALCWLNSWSPTDLARRLTYCRACWAAVRSNALMSRSARAAIALTVVLIDGGTGIVLLRQSLLRRRVREAAERRLSETPGERVTIGGMGIALFLRPALTGADIRVGVDQCR